MTGIVQPKHDGHWLVFRASIATEMRRGAVGKAVTEYYESIGFQQTAHTPSLIFERGSGLASLYHPNPRHQQTHITADIVTSGNDSIVELVMRVNRFGNKPLQPDYDFWQAEIDGLDHALNHGYCDPRLSLYASDRAQWYSVVVMLAILLGAVGVLTVLSLVLLGLLA